MEALKNITENVPTWSTRLGDLTGQIRKRQVDLAVLALQAEKAERQSESPKSLRNRGSTESLRPNDAETHGDGTDSPTLPDGHRLVGIDNENGHNILAADQSQSNTPEDPQSHSALQQQSNNAIDVAQAKAFAVVRKKIQTASLMSGDGIPVYHTRTMVIIYYDSYVQSFFEELVKFVSASRNVLRKARMAANMAKIRKLAEVGTSCDGSDDGKEAVNPDAPLLAADPVDAGSEEPLPPLRYMSTSRMAPISRTMGAGAIGPRSFGMGMGMRLGALDDKPSAFDTLDKILEAVQAKSEYSAHKFLRDGNCSEEIKTIIRRLTEANEMAKKEMERMEREEPELPVAPVRAEEQRKARAYKVPNMRKEGWTPKGIAGPPALEPAAPAAEVAIEVDDSDGNVETEPDMSKLVFRSTRATRRA